MKKFIIYVFIGICVCIVIVLESCSNMITRRDEVDCDNVMPLSRECKHFSQPETVAVKAPMDKKMHLIKPVEIK